MNERSILILSNGKASQIAQRRISGAEVVHGNAHAEVANLMQRRKRRVVVLHQHGFGHLEFEPVCRQAGCRETIDHRQRKRRVSELDRRDIDGDADVTRPIHGLDARPPEHPVADGVDQSGFFRDRNELERRNHAAFRMMPAQQRLAAGDGCRSAG